MIDSSQKIRTRFAPSPTGFVHIGSLRTALFSFLFARHNNGVHVLRIEDTDQKREVEGALENLLRVMKELGVEFDEGFYLDDTGDVKERGSFGPYLQSKRLELYQKYAKQLVEQSKAYYCFCDEQRLQEVRQEQTALKKPPMYDRYCRGLSAKEVTEKLTEFQKRGESPVIRQAIPEQGETIVPDLVYGNMTMSNSILDDQVLLKSDGFPTYHLAVVVDDHHMEITHVIRGEEWISSTPKHLLLYEAFGWVPPQFAHLPLILNPDKSKLSKRQGDVSVEDFLAKGYLKEALVNFVAFLGWNPKTTQEIFTAAELIREFDLAKVNNSPAILDMNKLDWLNGLYIRQMDVVELTDKVLPYWIKDGWVMEDATQFKIESGQIVTRAYLEAIVALEQERLKKLSQIGERTKYFFQDPEYDGALLIWKKSDAASTKNILRELQGVLDAMPEKDLVSVQTLEQKVKQFIADRGYDNGSVLWPLRMAMTGLDKSPSPFEVTATLVLGLGKADVLKRLSGAEGKLN